MEFYRCEHCGNIVAFLNKSGVPVVCCGEKMKLLEPGVVEAAVEKHLPVDRSGNQPGLAAEGAGRRRCPRG